MARRFVPLFAVLLLVAFSLPSATLAGPLHAIVTTLLDSTGNVGTYSSLVLDAESNPVISYRHQGDQNLKFIYCDDPVCSTSTIRTLDSSGSAGFFTSLKLNSQGNPVIAYFTSGGGLKLAICGTPTCEPGSVTIRTLDNVSANTWHPSLQLDANDNPVISYSRTTTPDIGLWLAYCANPACSSHQLTELFGGATQYSSLQLDSAGNPVISYLHTGLAYMGLVHCSDPQCSGAKSDVVIQATSSQDGTSLVLNASGNPIIAYRRSLPAALTLVTCKNPNCTSFEQNDLNSTGGLYMSLKLDPAGNPAVSYYTGNPDQNMVLARCTTPTCELGSVTNTTIANAGSPNYPSSMALDCSGNPVISYYHSSTAQNLRLAYEDTATKCAHFGGTPSAPGPLTFIAEPGESSQLAINVINDGMTDSLLDVSLHSISSGYDIVSGLTISDLATTDPAAIITVQCSSFPQAPGTLVLATNDPLQPTVTYTLSCKPPLENEESPATSTVISSAGLTTLQLGRLLVTLPANSIPPGQTGCQLSAAKVGSSAAYGFSLDDAVYDVKVHCDSGELNIFLAPITICIQPPGGVAGNKDLYHNHDEASFKPISGGSGPAGYVCGQTQVLSLFTLGQLALPATGFAPSAVTALSEQPAELAYVPSSLQLSIPKLGVDLDIVGVPQGLNGWDVSWLAKSQAGYLYGTSFPTWQGNSVLTAHVWNADNTPGPFHGLKDLQHGDRFTIAAYGYTYTYEVRSNRLVQPGSLAALAQSDYSLITLITCESFDAASGAYRYRRAVQAVLVQVD